MKLHQKRQGSTFIFDSHSTLLLSTAGKEFNNIDNSDESLTVLKNKEIALLSNYLRIDQKKIKMLTQIHGDKIINVDYDEDQQFPEADGMITTSTEICLVIRTADCVPVFVYDCKNKILGAVHSGWKGCRLDITGKIVKKLIDEYGSKINDLLVYILPSIGPDSYEIKMDVGQYFKDDTTKVDDKIYLNLWKNIYDSLIDINIPERNIFLSETCTVQNNYDFFSYRCGDVGRNLNFAYIKN